MTTNFTVKLGLDGLTPMEVVERGRAHVLALTGNLTYPTPTPALAAITTASNALETAEIAVTNNGGRQDTLVRNERMRDLKELIKQLAGYVQAVSGGDPELIASAAFTTRKLPVPSGILPAPGNLRVRITTLPGELNVRWKGVKDRRIYQMEINDGDPLVEASWKPLLMTGKNFHTATGLASHKSYSFRVNAVGADGVGPWSDIATSKPL
ncbi:MAG: fibronectin type III domain-containing protein [Flavobacteriales bacterium]|nr:fibronectin type III domain-containing protein [Flavobacteriales bacterium]